MAPLRGWCARGKRLVARVPYGHWKTSTFVAALRCGGIEAPCVFDGPINSARFDVYVEQSLDPRLGPGDIVLVEIWEATKAKQSETPFAPPEPSASSSRPIRPI